MDERSPLDIDPNAPPLTFQQESPGLRAGPLQLYPSVTVAPGFDSHVLGTQVNSKPDAIVVTEGMLHMDNQSDLLRFTSTAFARARRFPGTSAANTNEWGATGILDGNPTSHDEWTGQLTAQRRFESPTDIETPRNIPVSYYTDYGARLSEQHIFNRFSLRVSGDGHRLDYVDTTQKYRNHWFYNGELGGAYELRSGLSLVAIGYASRDQFDTNFVQPGTPLVDSATSVGGLLGAHLVFPELLDFELTGGPFKRTYDGGRGQLTGISVRGSLKWQPTQLTTVRADITREGEATRVQGLLGKTRTSVGSQLDHLYSSNLTLYARARVFLDDYGAGYGTGTTYIGEAGMHVLVSRRFLCSLSYEYDDRATYISGSKFQRHIAVLAFTRRF